MITEIVKQSFEKPHSVDQVQQAVRIVKKLNEKDWKQFVEQHPQGNIFHTPEMFNVFSRARGFHPMLYSAVRGDGQVEALFLPVQVTLNNLLRPLTTRAISYGSVLCMPSNEGRQALTLLLKTYVQDNRTTCLFTELRNVSDIEEQQTVLSEQGFVYEDHLNYLIDLNRSPEDLFQSIGARTRKNIRHGLNKGEVTIHEVTEPEQIGICYKILSQTYQNAKVPLADRSLFDAAFDLLYPKGMIRFALAYVGNEPVAVSVELLYKDVMYGWYGGMDRAYSRYVPNELLMWDVLKWGSENGYRLYDFGGAGKPDEEYGVRDFKAKFGGKLVCYGRNTYVHMPGVLWLSKQGYQVIRHLFIGRFSRQ
jgi:serine/alanine adding enzyme